MKKILLPAIVLTFIGCGKEFEPELTGWRAYTQPSRRVHLDIDGREKTLELPGDERIAYRYPQWTKFQDQILLTQIKKTESCYDYQVVSIDTTGIITDTVYTAPPNTALNFKLAPNDSLLLLKTYRDDCKESDQFRYMFYNRFLKKVLSDTITVGNSRGILLQETVWSPDSKKVIIPAWSSGRTVKAFVYDLTTKDTINIDKGSNFIWSPTDKNLVAYIKDHSIYTRNMETGEQELIFKKTKKKSVASFRWNPAGDFLMMRINGYILNIAPFENTTIMYLSMKNKRESRRFYEDTRIDTWK